MTPGPGAPVGLAASGGDEAGSDFPAWQFCCGPNQGLLEPDKFSYSNETATYLPKGQTMLLDWDNPPTLPSPRRKVIIDLLNRDRLGELQQRRRKHKCSKAHSTNRERSIAAKAKALRVKKNIAANEAAKSEYLAKVRAYWMGLTDEHP